MDFGSHQTQLGFFGGAAIGISPSSVIVTSGLRDFGFSLGGAFLSVGGPAGRLTARGDNGAVRFSIAPPLPPIHNRSPPR